MRYTVRKSYIDVIGNIWMPSSGTFAYRYDLRLYDVENIVKPINRDNVQDWLDKNAGDFTAFTTSPRRLKLAMRLLTFRGYTRKAK